jgi:hypothetical protein
LPAGEAFLYACVFAHVVGGRNVTMAGVAQLVRAPVCGTGGRRFETGHSPHHSFSLKRNKTGIMRGICPQADLKVQAVMDYLRAWRNW